MEGEQPAAPPVAGIEWEAARARQAASAPPPRATGAAAAQAPATEGGDKK